MWLERFSGQSAPSPLPVERNRSYSPAAPLRRSSHLAPNAPLQRPGLAPRDASTLSLLTNGSTNELPLAARLPNGSSLRNQLTSSPSNEAPDPLLLLRDILGASQIPGSIEHTEDGSCQEDKDIDGNVHFGGLSLQDFAGAVSPISAERHGETAELGITIEEFESEKDKFEDLHNSIAACDTVLGTVETYLMSFQADLATVSAEIETLQNRSAALNHKLETRKHVETLLGPEVDALSLSPAVVRKITEGSIDESWIKALDELEQRSKAIEGRSKDATDVKALADLQPFINNLKDRAIERIRDYVVAQIKALRPPGTNAQILQQNAFLKYKDVFSFLARHQPQLGEEISQAYINTMRWYYLSNFSRYKMALEKLRLHAFDQNDMLGNETNAKRGATLAGARQAIAPHDAFVLGRRADVVRTPTSSAVSSYVAEEDKSLHYLEAPFRAFNLALVDNASAEYSFLTEFFTKQSFHAVNRKFIEMFEPTLALGQAFTKQLVDPSMDALGILLCVRLNQHAAFELQRRKVPSMDGYINGTSMLLWPRFQKVMDMHCESLRKATTALPGRPVGSALSLTSSASTAQSVAPHVTTQKFANFTQGVLALSSDAGDDEPVSRSLGRLRADFELFLVKMSKGMAENKKRERFLLNNYSLVGTIINETEGKMADDIKSHFADLRDDLAQRQ